MAKSPPVLSDADLVEQAKVRQIPISNAKLLRQSLTHKSFVGEHHIDSNERLEFLGDSIVNQVVGEQLYGLYPDRDEGGLAKARALVVCKSALASSARRLGLVDLIVLGATEEALGGRSRSSLVADAYEAVVAAIYLENGHEVVHDFVLRTLAPELESVAALADWRDPKTTLQELCQAGISGLPKYTITAESGKPHDRTFTSVVHVGGKYLGTGTGKSKKEAEQAAAQQALSTISNERPLELE